MHDRNIASIGSLLLDDYMKMFASLISKSSNISKVSLFAFFVSVLRGSRCEDRNVLILVLIGRDIDKFHIVVNSISWCTTLL